MPLRSPKAVGQEPICSEPGHPCVAKKKKARGNYHTIDGACEEQAECPSKSDGPNYKDRTMIRGGPVPGGKDVKIEFQQRTWKAPVNIEHLPKTLPEGG